MSRKMAEHLLWQAVEGGDVYSRPIHWTCKYGVSIDGRVYRFSRDGDYAIRVSRKGDLPLVRFLAVPKFDWATCPHTGWHYRIVPYLDDYVVDIHGEEQVVLTTEGEMI